MKNKTLFLFSDIVESVRRPSQSGKSPLRPMVDEDCADEEIIKMMTTSQRLQGCNPYGHRENLAQATQNKKQGCVGVTLLA